MDVRVRVGSAVETAFGGQGRDDARVGRVAPRGATLRAMGREAEEGVDAVVETGVEDSGESGRGVHVVVDVGGRRGDVGGFGAGFIQGERAAVARLDGVSERDGNGAERRGGVVRMVRRAGVRVASRKVFTRYRYLVIS